MSLSTCNVQAVEQPPVGQCITPLNLANIAAELFSAYTASGDSDLVMCQDGINLPSGQCWRFASVGRVSMQREIFSVQDSIEEFWLCDPLDTEAAVCPPWTMQPLHWVSIIATVVNATWLDCSYEDTPSGERWQVLYVDFNGNNRLFTYRIPHPGAPAFICPSVCTQRF